MVARGSPTTLKSLARDRQATTNDFVHIRSKNMATLLVEIIAHMCSYRSFCSGQEVQLQDQVISAFLASSELGID